MKKTIAKKMANATIKVAQLGAGAASIFGTYQPKEPQALKNLKK